MADPFMRGRMGGMKHSSVRDLLFVVAIVAQLFVTSGCLQANRAADEHVVKAIDKRMKQIEKDAAKVPSGRDSESSESKDDGN